MFRLSGLFNYWSYKPKIKQLYIHASTFKTSHCKSEILKRLMVDKPLDFVHPWQICFLTVYKDGACHSALLFIRMYSVCCSVIKIWTDSVICLVRLSQNVLRASICMFGSLPPWCSCWCLYRNDPSLVSFSLLCISLNAVLT